MKKLIKVRSYDMIMGKYIDTYINPEKIIMLTKIEDDDEGLIYMCYLPDNAIRLSETSYYNLIHNFYGKEYKADHFVNTLINNLVDEIAEFVEGYTCTKSLELADEIIKKFKVEEIEYGKE